MKCVNHPVLPAVIGATLLAMSAGWAAGADYATTVLSQGPAGFWELNEAVPPQAAANLGSLGAAGNGVYQYDAVGGQPGALSGSTNTSVRFFNPLQEVTLGRSKVEVPYNAALNPQGSFTVEFWARPNNVVTDVFCPVACIDSDAAIAIGPDKNPRAGWLFYQQGTTNKTPNQWQFKLGNANNYLDGDAILGGTVTTGAWHHIVGVFDGAKASLYVNGISVASRAISGYQTNGARPLRIGTTCFDGSMGTFAGNRNFDGWIEEVALYGAALSDQDIAAHYAAATTNGPGYAALVLAGKPVGYWRLGESGNPPAVNLGSLGASGNGSYYYGVNPGQPGPRPSAYPGFKADNLACGHTGTNGYVDVPPLNLHTNTVTITAWIKPDGIQSNNTGIVFCSAGTTVAGLKFDVNDPNGLSYDWNNDSAAYNFKSSLAVPASSWSFVAMIVQPDQAILCLQDGTGFTMATNYTTHPEQAFETDSQIGAIGQDGSLSFQGLIDEVAIFSRTLAVGEVYSQYASAAGGLKPTIFTEVQAPAGAVYPGDPLTLSVDAGGTPPLGYQWRKGGSPIAGATSSTFTRAAVTAGDAGDYSVVITNAQGSVTSQTATVSIQPLLQPTISQDPEGRVVYVGGLLELTVQASGGDLAYRWEKNGSKVPGATNATYRVAQVSGTNAGIYQAIVSNPLGTASSASATIKVVVPPADSFEAMILADGPEAWWRLDDAPGATVLSDAMGRHDGVYKGTVTQGANGVIAGDTNTAVTFDGASGYAEVPFSKALNTTNFTIECWVRANPLARAMCPVGSFTQPPGRGYLFQKSEDGRWYYLLGNGVDQVVYYIDGSDALYTQWVHLAITYDGYAFFGYVNGQPDAAIGTDIVPNNVAPLRIGLDQTDTSWSDYWDGDIDEVAYYQKALTSDQIAAHYAAALYGVNSKPVFTRPPESVTFVAGSDGYLAPTVGGSLPMSLQWGKNGAPIPGETNQTLVITNLDLSDTGSYELTASNALGQVTSTAVTLTVVTTPAYANVTNDLVLHLKFDGDYTDASGRGNNGLAVGAPKFVAGAVGSNAVHVSTVVDASDPNNVVVTAANYVTLGKLSDLRFGTNVNFSVSYWVRFTGTPGDLPFLCNSLGAWSQPGYTFAPSYQLGGWSWSLGDSGSSSMIGIYGADGTLNDGNWHHLVHTFDRAGSGLTYREGNLVDSRSIVPLADLDTGEPTNIGQDASGKYAEAGELDIDDLEVWRRVLTAFEVTSIHSAGLAGRSFDTVAPPSVSVTLQRSGKDLQLLWQSGTLLQADDVKGPWSPVTGAAAPSYKLTPGTGNKFYRLQL